MTKEECEIETSKAIMEMRNHIAELEKENAEMKKQNSKAKELLTRFVMASVYFNGKEIDLIAEAESFLKGEKLFI